MPFKVACAQIAPSKGDLAANLSEIAGAALRASEDGADLVVFAEAAVTGYFLEGGVLECALPPERLLEELAARLQPTRPLDLVVGFYAIEAGNIYNACAYLEFGAGPARLTHVYHKFFLPTYGVFDEERFVTRGREAGVFDTRFGRVALLMCEDVWHSILPTICAARGASVFLIPSASPARGFSGPRPGNLMRYERLITAISEEHGVWCVNTQLIGFEGGKGFVGGSMIVDPMGTMVAQAPVQEEAIITALIEPEDVLVARSQMPLIGDLQTAWGDIQRLVAETSA